MKILIIGNIGSGKTTLGEELAKVLDFKFVTVDRLRERYQEGTVSGEYLTLHHFLKAIESEADLILEFTGAGCHKFAVRRALELCGHRCIIVVCIVKEIDAIKKRIEEKRFPTENPFDIEPFGHSEFVAQEIEEDLQAGFWEMDMSRVLMVAMDVLEDIEAAVNEVIQMVR